METKRFKIIYVDKRPARTVGAGHFERSSAFAPVLSLAVGESIERRYHSAGYKRITRLPDTR